jgi:hypothetical protein
MDPILYKKLDWELTHGQDLLHLEATQAADCEQVRTRGGAVVMVLLARAGHVAGAAAVLP